MDGFHAHRAEEGRREHGEEREQDKEGNRIGQLVSHDFDRIQKTVHERFFAG